VKRDVSTFYFSEVYSIEKDTMLLEIIHGKTNSVFEAITQSMTYISFMTSAEDDELCVEFRILSI